MSSNGEKPKEIEEEKKIEGKNEAAPVDVISWFALFKYADAWDFFCLTIGTGGAMFMGASLPLFTILLGNLLNVLGKPNQDKAHQTDDIRRVCLYFVGLACLSFAAGYLQISNYTTLAMRISNRLRLRYLQAALRQDISFFDIDTSGSGVLNSINEDTSAVQAALADKAAIFVQGAAAFITGFVVAFWRAWEVAAIGAAAFPMMILGSAAFGYASTRVSVKAQGAYNKANSSAQETLMNVRTVQSFNMEKTMVERFRARLREPLKAGIFHAWSLGFSMGLLFASIFATYAVVMRWGSYRVANGHRTGGDVVNVILALIIAGFSLGQALPSLSFFRQGRLAGARIYRVIDRVPSIDSASQEGIKDVPLKGEVGLVNVTFRYPARPDITVFNNFNITIGAGKSMALVGESGSGKSTIIGLVERFYDPISGQVLLDGMDLRKYNIRWLRSQIGLVSQEPTLFQTSIKENILYGRFDASDAEIEAALKAANAWGFIQRLPDGLNTMVGERGLSLSGGQKQRICIARAVLRNPRVLLLDEATSALDAESEKIVQDALDRLMVGRTTIVVAHRLSTVRDCNCISVLQRGKIVEQGTHEELVGKQGAYYELVKLQQRAGEDEPSTSESESEEEAVVVETTPVQILAAATKDDVASPKANGVNGAARKSNVRSSQDRGFKASMDQRHVAGGKRASSEVPADGKHPLDVDEVRISKEDEEAEAKRQAEEEKAKKAKAKGAFRRFARLIPDQIPVMALGTIASAGLGIVMPIYALILSEVIGVFYKPKKSEIINGGQFWALMFMVIAIGAFFCHLTQQRCLYGSGQVLAMRLREVIFASVLSQDIGFFDMPENSTGAISTRLSQDALYVRGAVGDQLGTLLMNLAVITASLTIAFTASWKVTIVIFAALPALAVGGVFQAKVVNGFEREGGKMFEKANALATDAFASVRVCAAFGLEAKVLDLYTSMLKGPSKKNLRSAQINGLGWGYANWAQFALIALGFWWGGRLVVRGEITLVQLLRSFFAILFAGIGAAQAQIAFPDAAKASEAIQRVFALLDRTPAVVSGTVLPEKDLKGDIELRNVTFRYPSRPNVTVFHHFNLTVPAGKTVALVGESGSGKSTVIGLLERFYDPASGQVLLDGMDLKSLNLQWVRNQIGLVSQEPSLFDGTIKDNILFGKPGATDMEVEAAAKAANAHDFILRQPQGYDTPIGERGLQLSGGQKQRLAIARAVLKNPRVLLLDEATSALDAESEKVVQEALDRLMVGRTTVVIAHRLSTIIKADIICVVQRGKIVEQGSHEELLKNPEGAYTKLIKIQLAGGH